MERLVVLEQLHVRTTALEAIWKLVSTRRMKELCSRLLTLKLDLVLNDKSVLLVVNGLGELGGDGVVSSFVLDDQALIALHALEHRRLLDGPGADVCPLLVVGLDVLLCVRGLPSVLPVVCELLEERRLELGGLRVYC